MTSKASLTVIIPVYNEEKYLGATLKSVSAAEKYFLKEGRSLRVVVSNNGSTDKSAKIIQDFSWENQHWIIRVQETALSADNHFFGLLQECDTEFLSIVGGHDLISKSYFFELEKLLRNNPKSPLSFSREFVDEAGKGLEAREALFQYNFSVEPIARFWQSLFYLSNATCIQGVIRTELMKNISGHLAMVSDLVWLHGLLKSGPFLYSNLASYVRTNPQRYYKAPSSSESRLRLSKSSKLQSNKSPMHVALVQAWKPSQLSNLNTFIAYWIIKKKFSLRTYEVFLFRLLRKISVIRIAPACGAKKFSQNSLNITSILEH